MQGKIVLTWSYGPMFAGAHPVETMLQNSTATLYLEIGPVFFVYIWKTNFDESVRISHRRGAVRRQPAQLVHPDQEADLGLEVDQGPHLVHIHGRGADGQLDGHQQK